MATEARVEATLGGRGRGEALAQAERRKANHVNFTIEEIVRLHACVSERAKVVKRKVGLGKLFHPVNPRKWLQIRRH
jgi:hypothetical protein